MINNNQIHIEHIVKDETMKANGRLDFLNDLVFVCLKRGLTEEEYIEVYEKVIRNIMKICESRLKLGVSKKERYKEEITKMSRASCADKSNPNSF